VHVLVEQQLKEKKIGPNSACALMFHKQNGFASFFLSKQLSFKRILSFLPVLQLLSKRIYPSSCLAVVFKKRRRKGYKKKKGSRRLMTVLKVLDIQYPDVDDKVYQGCHL
jgi:hypothetical protein